LINIGAVLTILWGIGHLFPTKNIVKDFGDITQDNKDIITMEWIIEGMALIFIGVLVTIITIIGESCIIANAYVNLISSIILFCLTIFSLFTGARAKFIVFKLCPVIFTTSGILILLGTYL
jgi:hypothetical protein